MAEFPLDPTLSKVPLNAIRSSPALDHIPLYGPLYGGVYREGPVTCYLSLPLPLSLCPPPHPQTHLHRAPHVTRAIAFNGEAHGRVPARPDSIQGAGLPRL